MPPVPWTSGLVMSLQPWYSVGHRGAREAHAEWARNLIVLILESVTLKESANERACTRKQAIRQHPMRSGSRYRARQEHVVVAGVRLFLSARAYTRFYSGACSASYVALNFSPPPPNGALPPQAAGQKARAGARRQHSHAPCADSGQAGMPVPPCPVPPCPQPPQTGPRPLPLAPPARPLWPTEYATLLHRARVPAIVRPISRAPDRRLRKALTYARSGYRRGRLYRQPYGG